MREDQTYSLETVRYNGRDTLAYRIPYQNVYETLAATAARVPDKVALIDPERSITYTELLKEVDALAASFAAKGLHAGDCMALMMVNSIEFVVAFYAALKLGVATVLVNTKLSPAEAKFIIADSGAGLLVCDTDRYEKIRSILPETQVKEVLVKGEAFRSLVEEGARLPQADVVKDDTLVGVLMYTSGTTGFPKGAEMTHFNLMQAFYAYGVCDNMDGHETTVIAVPMFHITGLNCVLTLFIFLGGTCTLVPYFDAEKVLDIMTESRCTYFHAVATVFILLESALQERHDLSSLTDALCGGGFISQTTIERFCAKAPNCRFHPVYGMTETAGAGTYFVGHCLARNKKDSCGKISENCELQIVDDANCPLPSGVKGEICFRGSYIIDHYLHGVCSDSFTDGWLHSGDIGHLDEDGYLFIVDRKKDMINRGGEKIYSLEVENAMMEFGNIKQCCVFAVKDSLYGEVAGAVVIPEPGHTIDLEALHRFLYGRIAHFKIPKYVEIRESVPTTANGKPRKAALREEFDQKYKQ